MQVIHRDICIVSYRIVSYRIAAVELAGWIPDVGRLGGGEASADDDAEKWDDDAGERDGREHLDELDADSDDQRQQQHHDGAVETEVVPRVVMDVAEHCQTRRDVQLQRSSQFSSVTLRSVVYVRPSVCPSVRGRSVIDPRLCRTAPDQARCTTTSKGNQPQTYIIAKT